MDVELRHFLCPQHMQLRLFYIGNIDWVPASCNLKRQQLPFLFIQTLQTYKLRQNSLAGVYGGGGGSISLHSLEAQVNMKETDGERLP